MLTQSCSTLCRSTPWTVASQVPLSRQEHWSRLPLPTSRDRPDPGIEPASLASPALASGLYHFANLGSPELFWTEISLLFIQNTQI